MTLGWRSRIPLLLAFVLVCVALVAWFALRSPVADLAGRWPDARRLEALTPYTAAAAPMPPIDDYTAHRPALPAPLPRPPERVVEAAPVVPGWKVSAILISGNRPMAIVDDQQVRPGDRLGDGTLVEQIEPSQVILRDVRGDRHALRVSSEH